MTMRIYKVVIGQVDGGQREVQAPSKTDVQAADAVAPLVQPGETILSITESDEDPYQDVDVGPPGTQTHPDQIT